MRLRLLSGRSWWPRRRRWQNPADGAGVSATQDSATQDSATQDSATQNSATQAAVSQDRATQAVVQPPLRGQARPPRQDGSTPGSHRKPSRAGGRSRQAPPAGPEGSGSAASAARPGQFSHREQAR